MRLRCGVAPGVFRDERVITISNKDATISYLTVTEDLVEGGYVQCRPHYEMSDHRVVVVVTVDGDKYLTVASDDVLEDFGGWDETTTT